MKEGGEFVTKIENYWEYVVVKSGKVPIIFIWYDPGFAF